MLHVTFLLNITKQDVTNETWCKQPKQLDLNRQRETGLVSLEYRFMRYKGHYAHLEVFKYNLVFPSVKAFSTFILCYVLFYDSLNIYRLEDQLMKR